MPVPLDADLSWQTTMLAPCPKPPCSKGPCSAARRAIPVSKASNAWGAVMGARVLTPQELALHCDPTTLLAETHVEAGIVGQARALAAVRFGIAMAPPDCHLFVMGPAGSGKRSLVRSAIAAHLVHDGIHRSDWVYVHNFETPHRPIALQLPAGRSARLRADLRTPVGFSFAPRKGDELMSTQDFEALPPEERQRLQEALAEPQDQSLHALRWSLRVMRGSLAQAQAQAQALLSGEPGRPPPDAGGAGPRRRRTTRGRGGGDGDKAGACARRRAAVVAALLGAW